MKMTGAQAVIQALVDLNVATIYGYPGGAIMPVYDALFDYEDKIKHILVRHEQGAVHAAEGEGRITGRPGVCMATSGPGATNLVTGIADAMMDSVPILCLTGQVPQHLIGTDAFQETDVIGITTPITKWNFQITAASEAAYVIAKAYAIAREGRPGPVLVDITKDAQYEETEYVFPEKIEIRRTYSIPRKVDTGQMRDAAALLNKAKKPMLIAGHGVLISDASAELKQFVEASGIPVVNTLHGISAFPTDHPQYVGWVGMHGNYGPNILTNQADVILAVGMRFDDRVTGRTKDYAKQAKVIHIDIDPAELNKNVPAEIGIHADAKKALKALTPLMVQKDRSSWIKKFHAYDKIEYRKVIKPETEPADGQIKMGEVIKTLSDLTQGDAILVPDVGQHQMIAAQYFKAAKPHSFISSGGLGTMGFALPAAIGAKVAAPDRQVIAVIGDGSFQMTMQELMTISQEQMPVKVIILNNNYLGMVRQWQQLFYERRYSFVDIQNPDFIQLAKGFYIDAEKINDRADLADGLDRMLRAEKPYLLEIPVEKEANVFPMIPSGYAVDEIILEPETTKL